VATHSITSRSLPQATGEITDELGRFERHLRSENKAPRTIQAYLESTRRLIDFLSSRRMPRNQASCLQGPSSETRAARVRDYAVAKTLALAETARERSDRDAGAVRQGA